MAEITPVNQNLDLMNGEAGRVSKKMLAVLTGGAMLIGAYIGPKIGLWDGPVTAEGEVEIEADKPKIYTAEVDINSCVVYAEGGLDVRGSLDVTVGLESPKLPVIGRLGAHHTFENLNNTTAHVEGDFDVCSPFDSIKLTYNPEYDASKPENATEAALVVDVKEMEARRPRVTNLGQPGSVDGGNGLLLDLAGLVGSDTDEAEFAGILQNVGQQVLAEGLCDELVMEKASQGYEEFGIAFMNKGLSAMGEPLIQVIDDTSGIDFEKQQQIQSRQSNLDDESHVLIEKSDILVKMPQTTGASTGLSPKESAEDILSRIMGDQQQDGLTITVVDAACPAGLNLEAVDRAVPVLSTEEVGPKSEFAADHRGDETNG